MSVVGEIICMYEYKKLYYPCIFEICNTAGGKVKSLNWDLRLVLRKNIKFNRVLF